MDYYVGCEGKIRGAETEAKVHDNQFRPMFVIIIVLTFRSMFSPNDNDNGKRVNIAISFADKFVRIHSTQSKEFISFSKEAVEEMTMQETTFFLYISLMTAKSGFLSFPTCRA